MVVLHIAPCQVITQNITTLEGDFDVQAETLPSDSGRAHVVYNDRSGRNCSKLSGSKP